MALDIERDILQPYYKARLKQAEAITYQEQLALIAQIEEELKNGRFPDEGGQTFTIPADSPIVQKVVAGEAVSFDEVDAEEVQPRVSKRTALLVSLAGFLFMLGSMGGLTYYFFNQGEPEVEVIDEAAAEPDVETAAEPQPAVTAIATLEPILPTLTPFPTPTPLVAAEPFATVPVVERPVGDSIYDPTSIEIAGRAIPLSVASPRDRWLNEVEAQWLEGTELRRVLALPYDAALLNSLLGTYDVMRVRLRSGGVVSYRLTDVVRVNRTQTEFFWGRTPSIAIVLVDESEDPRRWVVLGEALQQETADSPFAVGLRPTPQVENGAITLIGNPATVGEARVRVEQCRREAQLTGRSPVSHGQQFLVCNLVLQGNVDEANLYISEFEWLQDTAWQPEVQLLNDFEDSQSRIIRLAGIVRSDARSYPVLAWDSAEQRHLIVLRDQIEPEAGR